MSESVALSRRSVRRWLWIAALLTLPVPFYLGQVEWAPVARLGFLTALLGAVVIAEGGRTLALLVGIGLLQTAVLGGLFLLAAGVAARGFERIGSEPLRIAAVGTAIFLLGVSSLLPIYETPLSSARPRSNVFQIFE